MQDASSHKPFAWHNTEFVELSKPVSQLTIADDKYVVCPEVATIVPFWSSFGAPQSTKCKMNRINEWWTKFFETLFFCHLQKKLCSPFEVKMIICTFKTTGTFDYASCFLPFSISLAGDDFNRRVKSWITFNSRSWLICRFVIDIQRQTPVFNRTRVTTVYNWYNFNQLPIDNITDFCQTNKHSSVVKT